jgi:HlyD family secretion protein
MDLAAPIFRQSALEKLNSPEKLDEAIRITSPTGWLAALGILLLIAAALTWGIFGSVPTRLTGNGIILYDDAVTRNAVAEVGGVLAEIKVAPGDTVVAGQIIAVVETMELAGKIESGKVLLADFEAQKTRLAEQRDQQLEQFKRYLVKRRAELHNQIKQAKVRIGILSIVLKEGEALLERGLTLRRTVETTRRDLFQTRQEEQSAISQLTKLGFDKQQKRDSWFQQLAQIDQRIIEQRNRVNNQELQLKHAGVIRSPSSGEVEQVLATMGSFVATGGAVATITDTSGDLGVSAFLTAADAKRVKVDMLSQVAPGTAKKEEFGTIVGRVESVSRHPLSTKAMLSLLKNDNLVKLFNKQGPPLLVRIHLERESEGGGLRWSSNRAPPFDITPGTISIVTITIREQPPITLIIPAFRKLFGLAG